MRKLALVSAIVACALGVAHGQGVSFQANIIDTVSIQGTKVLRPLGSATVYICAAANTVCDGTNPVSIYSDNALTVPMANPVTPDAMGYISFYTSPGQFKYTIYKASGPVGTYPVTVGGSGGSSLPSSIPFIGSNGAGQGIAAPYTPVNKAGDTMTGALVLSGDPAAALQAATKQYVDAKAGSAIPAGTGFVRQNGTTTSVSALSATDVNGVGAITNSTSGNAATATTATTATTAGNLAGTPTLPNGTAAVTQTTTDSTTRLATDAFVQNVKATIPTATTINSVNCPLGGSCTIPTGGSGNVTTFSSGNASPLFTTSVANPTSTPAQSFTLSSAAANTFFGSPNGTAGAGSYRRIAAPDISDAGCVTGGYSPVQADGSFTACATATTNTGVIVQQASSGTDTKPLVPTGAYLLTQWAGYPAAVDSAGVVTPLINSGTFTTSQTVAVDGVSLSIGTGGNAPAGLQVAGNRGYMGFCPGCLGGTGATMLQGNGRGVVFSTSTSAFANNVIAGFDAAGGYFFMGNNSSHNTANLWLDPNGNFNGKATNLATREVTNNYTVGATDSLIRVNTNTNSLNITITLETAPAAGHVITIKHDTDDAHTVTIVFPSALTGGTIDGATTYVIPSASHRGSVTIVPNAPGNYDITGTV